MTRTELRDELQSFGERINAKLDAKFEILIEMLKAREANFKTRDAEIDKKLDALIAKADKIPNRIAIFTATIVGFIVLISQL